MNRLIAPAIFLLVTSATYAQWPQPFVEEFDNAEQFQQLWFPIDSSVVVGDDGMPNGEYAEWGPGILDIAQGNLHIQTTNPVPLSAPEHFGDETFFDTPNVGTTGAAWLPSLGQPISDATVRTMVRVDSLTNAAIAMRSNLETFSNYNFTAAGAEGKFAISRFTNGVMDRVEFFDDLTLNVGDDWWMEGSTIGNQIALKAWKDGSPEPAAPQFRWTDDTHTSGGIGIAGVVQNNMVPSPTRIDATFDNVDIKVLDPPVLPTEFTDNDFANWGTSPLGLPGNLNWSISDSSIFGPGLVPRPEPEAWGPAIVDASAGNLQIRSTNPIQLADPAVYPHGDKTVFPFENSGLTNVIWNPSLETPVADASVRTKIHLDTASQQSILMRVIEGGSSGYTFTASGATNEFGISRFDAGVMTRVEFTEGSDFQVGEDWWMEGNAIGDQLSLWAWRDGEEKPDEPLLQWTDDTYQGGLLTLNGIAWANNIVEPTHVNVTFDDVSITGATPFLFCAPLNELAGDLDGNGTVGFTDFLLLANSFGEQVATYGQGDIDCSGSVEFTDFLALSENFGKSLGGPAAAAVPEPTGFGPLAFALLIGLCARRTRFQP